MKTILALVLAAGAFGTATAQTTVSTSVSIGINQPGVYGRINIGDLPHPALYHPQPVIVDDAARRRGASARSISTCRRRTSRTGAATAASTTPAASRSTSSATSGCASATSTSIRAGTTAAIAAGTSTTATTITTTTATATARKASTELRLTSRRRAGNARVDALERAAARPAAAAAAQPSSCFWNTSPACSRSAWNRIFGQLLSIARSSGAYSTSTVGASTAS